VTAWCGALAAASLAIEATDRDARAGHPSWVSPHRAACAPSQLSSPICVETPQAPTGALKPVTTSTAAHTLRRGRGKEPPHYIEKACRLHKELFRIVRGFVPVSSGNEADRCGSRGVKPNDRRAAGELRV